MAKPIKYLTYQVIKSGNVVSSGTVPSIIALSGCDKSYNLGGAWLWHTVSELTELELNDGTDLDIHYSDRVSANWKSYMMLNKNTDIDLTW